MQAELAGRDRHLDGPADGFARQQADGLPFRQAGAATGRRQLVPAGCRLLAVSCVGQDDTEGAAVETLRLQQQGAGRLDSGLNRIQERAFIGQDLHVRDMIHQLQPAGCRVAGRPALEADVFQDNMADIRLFVVSLDARAGQGDRQRIQDADVAKKDVPDRTLLVVFVPDRVRDPDVEQLGAGRVLNADILEMDIRNRRAVAVVDAHQGIAGRRVDDVDVFEPDVMHPLGTQFHPHLDRAGEVVPERAVFEQDMGQVAGVEGLGHQ